MIQRWWQQQLCYDRLMAFFVSCQTETVEREVALEAERLAAAVKLQAVIRSYISRLEVQQQIGERIFEDEKWRIYLLREREAQQLQRQALPSHISALRKNQLALREWRHKQQHQIMNNVLTSTKKVAAGRERSMTGSRKSPSPKDQPQPQHEVSSSGHAKGDDGLLLQALGVDVLVDTSEIFPKGWSKTWGQLAEKLAHGVDEEDTESLAHGVQLGASAVEAASAAPLKSKSPGGKMPPKPKQVSVAFGGGRLVQLGVGESHCVALDDCGRVYTWGLQDDGQLGYEQDDHEHHHTDHAAGGADEIYGSGSDPNGYPEKGGLNTPKSLGRGRAATAIRSLAEAEAGEAPARLVRKWWVPDMAAGTSTHQVAKKGMSTTKGWTIGGPLSAKPHCGVYIR
jgi:hypothetical protein